jgi:hypothetical protein
MFLNDNNLHFSHLENITAQFPTLAYVIFLEQAPELQFFHQGGDLQ